VALYRPREWPSVDVFLPSAGEPLSILENTYGTSPGCAGRPG
jgi:cellulose synthase (UDP-forming)